MPSAEIIAIGSELLLGETQDTNTQFLLRTLRDRGINVFRTMIIGDNATKIAAAIKEGFLRTDIIITTGGLGPTVDDPTREAAALAFDTNLIFDESLWEDIQIYFGKMKRTTGENNKRQAYIPETALPIPNEVGTAPAFYIYQNQKLLVSLPGVPYEMKHIALNRVVPLLQKLYPVDETIVVRTLHSYGLGESVVDELIGDLETSANPTLGLSAKAGQIDLRITAKGPSVEEANRLISGFEKTIRERLGKNIFGTEEDTLQVVTNKLLRENAISLSILEVNTSRGFTALIAPEVLRESRHLQAPEADEKTSALIEDFFSKTTDGFAIVCEKWNVPDNQFINIKITLKTPDKRIKIERWYNGLTYSENQSFLLGLDTIRKAVIGV